MKRSSLLIASILLGCHLVACGGGAPVRVRIDEFTVPLDLDETAAQLETELQNIGMLPLVINGLPEKWPDSLPDINFTTTLAIDPIPIDLTPEEGTEEFEKYKEINDVKDLLRRIEINRLVLRVDQSTLSVPLPQLSLQVADTPDADPDNRRAWFTVGKLAGAPPGFVGDIDFDWVVGGESYLNAQLGDELKEFAIRPLGKFTVDTTVNRDLPRGKANLRLIVVATFFIEPEKAL